MMTELELKEKQATYNKAFWKKAIAAQAAGGPKPRKTGYPKMTYAYPCAEMRTLHGDAVNSNCKDYRERG